MSEWHTETLGQLADAAGGVIRTGPFGSQLHRHEYIDDGEVAVVMPKDMIDGRIASNSIARIDRDTAARLAEHLLRPADIVLARRGDIGRAAWVHPRDGAVLCGTGSMRIHIPDGKVAPRYLHYFLQAGAAAEWLQGHAVGATMPNLSEDIVRGLPVRYPNPQTQKKIIEILDSIDDLIENNRRRIALLEQMAQTIYREWFVHFRYPGHAEDELVDSPLGPIPEGWKVSTLGERLSVLESGSRPRGGIDPKERGVPSVGAENILGPGRYRFQAEKYVSESFYESMRRGRVEDGDVLLYKDGAHIGRHSLFRDGFPHSRCVINEHVFRLQVRPPMTQSYLYFWIDRPETVEDIVSLNSNAAARTLAGQSGDAFDDGADGQSAEGLG